MENYTNFPVTIYGELKPYNDVLSQARCRIFYKYKNRNGTFITDEFAKKLISSLSYTPVKGIYNEFEEDYKDHGKKRSQGRIYGIVPESLNFKWEKHLYEDGIERTYACCDVLLFTGLYEEASEILGKGQSMELYPPSLKGSMKKIDGEDYYVYTDGCFLGLQVLGDDVEPCFEGAAFYSLYTSLKDVVDKFEKIVQNKGGQNQMKNLFRLSYREKYDAIFKAVNQESYEANGCYSYGVIDVFDDYALIKNFETEEIERAYYTKEDNSVTIYKKKRCYILDVTEEELSALNAIRAFNGDTFENANVICDKVTNLETQNSEFEHKIVELENSVSTLNMDKQAKETEFTELQDQFTHLSTEAEELRAYKLAIEKAEKEQVITKYSKQLSEDIISKYTEKLAEFSVSELEKELAFEMVQNNPGVFGNSSFQFIPKDQQLSGLEGILNQYTKK